MTVETLNPPGLHRSDAYSQVAVARGGRTIYLSGQVAFDEKGVVVGSGSLELQTEQVFLNIAAALKAVGAGFQDVARMTVYVPGWQPEMMEQLMAGAMRAAPQVGFDGKRPMTLLGVSSLALPELLIEVDVIAVAD